MKYAFSAAERYAVFKTHGDRCYICREPIDMVSFQVDHVLPESLLLDTQRLEKVLRELGRPDTFKINSFENWLPACPRCNNNKRALVWEPSLLVQLDLQKAAEKAQSASEEASALLTRQQVARALNTLLRAYENDSLTDDVKAQLQPLVEDYAAGRSPDSAPDIVRLTPDYAPPLFQVLTDDGKTRIVQGPYGVGGGPSREGREIPSAMRCGVCGYPYFTGARCVICGNMDDGD